MQRKPERSPEPSGPNVWDKKRAELDERKELERSKERAEREKEREKAIAMERDRKELSRADREAKLWKDPDAGRKGDKGD